MRYGSVCSGIEAATVAWSRLGWQAAFYSEIEPFPSHVLHEHYSSGRPQYKAFGNSMSTNVILWIGQRIEIVDALEFREAAE